MSTDSPEDVAETLAFVLDGRMGLNLAQMGWACAEMDGLPELYVRNGAGELFRLSCEKVGEGEFDPFEQLEA